MTLLVLIVVLISISALVALDPAEQRGRMEPLGPLPDDPRH